MQENKTQPYDEGQMNRLQRHLINCSEQNTPKFYEIIVDGIKVISRTNNPSEFGGYKGHLDRDAKNLRVIIYNDNGFENKDEYNYSLREEKENKNQLTGPLDLDQRINEKITAAKKEWDYDHMVKEKAQLEADLRQANEYIETLEKRIEGLKNKKFQLGDVNIGEIASVMFEGIIRRNKDKIAKLPGLEGLMGIFDDSPAQLSEAKQEKETEVTFERETSSEPSEEEKIFIAVAHWLKDNFSKEELPQVDFILKAFAQDKKLIGTVFELLKQNQK